MTGNFALVMEEERCLIKYVRRRIKLLQNIPGSLRQLSTANAFMVGVFGLAKHLFNLNDHLEHVPAEP